MTRTLNALTALVFTIALVALVYAVAVPSADADTSGPNASGYIWIDSNAPDPTVAFEWIDATDGTALGLDDDDYDTGIALPFTFNFFGEDHTAVDISSNGFLSFDLDSECNEGYNWDDVLTPGVDAGHPIPFTDTDCTGDSGWGGNPLIAGWFDDLDPGECGDVYYKTVGSAPDQQFVVEWDTCHNDCDLCDDSDKVTFEIILFEGSNDIKIQYQDTVFDDSVEASDDILEENHGNTATSGIDFDDTVGLGYHWGGEDTDALTDGLAVLYTRNAADLEITKEAGVETAEVGDEITYTLTVTNNGPDTANFVEVTDELPEGTEFVSATPSQGDCAEAAGVVTCELGDIALDATATVDLVVKVTAEGTIENTASVASEETDVTPANDTSVAAVAVGPNATPVPTPTASPAQLPETGGSPDSGSGVSAAVVALVLAVLAGGVTLGALKAHRSL
jgi:uncharacterized repeat protein (TIGR01451 family)